MRELYKSAVYAVQHTQNVIVVVYDVVAANLIISFELIDDNLRISTNVQSMTTYIIVDDIFQRLVQSLVFCLVIGNVVSEIVIARRDEVAVDPIIIHLVHHPTATSRPMGIVSRRSVEVDDDPVIMHAGRTWFWEDGHSKGSSHQLSKWKATSFAG